jgi:hypothetical protein
MTTAGAPTTAPAPPRTLPAEKPDDAPSTMQRHITFGMGMGDEGSHGMGEGEMAFTIDGRTLRPGSR